MAKCYHYSLMLGIELEVFELRLSVTYTNPLSYNIDSQRSNKISYLIAKMSDNQLLSCIFCIISNKAMAHYRIIIYNFSLKIRSVFVVSGYIVLPHQTAGFLCHYKRKCFLSMRPNIPIKFYSVIRCPRERFDSPWLDFVITTSDK